MMNRDDMTLLLNALVRNAIAYGAAETPNAEAIRGMRIDELKAAILYEIYGENPPRITEAPANIFTSN